MPIPNEQGIGGGKYDPECEVVLGVTRASLVAVIILRGSKGTGFSVSTLDPKLMEQLPDMLEFMAKDIRAAIKNTKLS